MRSGAAKPDGGAAFRLVLGGCVAVGAAATIAFCAFVAWRIGAQVAERIL